MVKCCGIDCQSRSRRSTDSADAVFPSFHKIPSEEESERRALWLKVADLNRLSECKDARICDNHFTADQFEIDRQVKHFHCT